VNYYILVNKDNRLDKDFIPNDLVITDENENNFHEYLNPNLKPMINKEVFKYFLLMQEDAKTNGFNILIDSGYRSYQYQEEIWNDSVIKIGLEETKRVVAPPGASEHQTGLSFDVGYIINGAYTDDVDEFQEESKWLFNNSYKYGFILRYPKNKENITGYKYEPWHYRFVGIDLAKELYENNITLEEYYLKEKIKTYRKVK